jgi:hypothetical protein
MHLDGNRLRPFSEAAGVAGTALQLSSDSSGDFSFSHLAAHVTTERSRQLEQS